ncbi:T9SS type A sorting domain-containing protein [Rubrivirga sp.]|uniref:T9SS type A sorting domain-containing protein n=1 Tax=Rubrivirga sp. TaxID=1885344 RepID=UPI003B523EDE
MPAPLRTSLLLLTVVLGAALSAQAQPTRGCETPSLEGARPDETPLGRHLEAVRRLPGRADPEAAPCAPRRSSDALAHAAAEDLVAGLVDSSTELQQVWRNGAWERESRFLRTFDAQGQVVERVRQVPDGDGWRNAERTESAVDGANEVLTQSVWQDGAWVPTRRFTFFYREDGISFGDRTEIWDAEAGVWRVESELTVTYDAQDRLVEVRSDELDTETLETLPVQRSLASYSEDGLVATTVVQRWLSGAWAPISRTTTTANADGTPASILSELREGGAWTPDTRTLYTTTDGVDQVLSQEWDPAAADWVDTFRTLLTTDGAETVEVTEANSEDGWVPVTRISSVLDAASRLVEYVVSYWDGSAWVFERRLRRGYSGDELTTETMEDWDAGAQAWRLSARSDDTFTPDGDPLRKQYVAYLSDGVHVGSGDDTVWEYDASGRVTSRTRTVWDPAAQTWVNDRRSLFGYDGEPVARDDAPVVALALSVRPNPVVAGGSVWVSGVAPSARVDVIDVLGRRVAQLHDGPLAGGVALALPALAPGTYIARITSGSEIASRTITVVR